MFVFTCQAAGGNSGLGCGSCSLFEQRRLWTSRAFGSQLRAHDPAKLPRRTPGCATALADGFGPSGCDRFKGTNGTDRCHRNI